MNTKLDIFASPKQHSLFPLAIPCLNISKEDYHIFYHHERRLFTLLIKVLHQEVGQSILVLGFLLWLEREGYTSKNLVQAIVDCLSLSVIDLVIDDVMICLKCIKEKGIKLLLEGSSTGHDILLLKNLLDRKRICLHELHENRDWIFNEVSNIAKDVSGKALDDILQQFKRSGTRSTMAGVGVGGSRPILPFPSYEVYKSLRFYHDIVFAKHQDRSIVDFGNANCALLNPMIEFGKHKDLILNVKSITRNQEHEVSPDDRTIFLTFSKGYPISENELRDYFNSYFGDFIEEIYMHEVRPDKQALYARIVVCSPLMVKAIVERDGLGGKSKYNINGKHVWARKYVKKKPVRVPPTPPTTTEVITPPQP